MQKTITISEGHELTLSNNVAWLMEYRDQFGRDIVPTITPLIGGILDLISQIAASAGNVDSISLADYAALDSETKTDIMIKLSTLELVDFINITWSMARAADDSLPEPRVWVRQFEEFPLDLIVPAIAELTIKGLSSSKNWERLQDMLKTMQPKKTTKKKK